MSEETENIGKPPPRQLPKRFYESVTAVKSENGFQILLDGRPVKTPRKNILSAPTHTLSAALVKEWDQQKDVIDPAVMPLTKILNTATDRVVAHKEAIIDELVSYAGTDMICYRASDPESLVAVQKEYWDPLLAWVKSDLDISLTVAEGVIHIDQQEQEIEKIRRYLTPKSACFIAAFHALTTLSGSLIIALALTEDEISLEKAWKCAHLDADWQTDRWGIDEEAEIAKNNAFQEFEAACILIKNI